MRFLSKEFNPIYQQVNSSLFTKSFMSLIAGFALLAIIFSPSVAYAQDTMDTGDTTWILVSSALVLLMTLPGLALLYGGMVRKKNVLAMVTQIFTMAAVASVVWVVIGYSLAFTDGGSLNPWVGGLDQLFLAQLTPGDLSGTIPESAFIMFQMTFAVITPALIAGAIADRMKFSSAILFMTLWLIVVYLPVCHWVWGGGFLSSEGVLDFAGGTVVHINAGIAGLVAAIVLGPRHGYGRENMAPHNLVLSMIGASMLWIGWFGFNAGSALASGEGAAFAMLVTQVAAAAGTLSWLFVEWYLRGKPSLLGGISGAIAGLVAITPAAGFVGVTDAIFIGAASGVVCLWGSSYLKRLLGYDDTLDVFGIHGLGGIVGAVLTGVFARDAIGGASGLLEGNPGQVWIQFFGLFATIAWSAIASYGLLKLIGLMTSGIRVSQEAEVEGLDVSSHGEVVQ